MSNIHINWISHSTDCETCGSSYAEGAVVSIDGEVVIDMTPHAACYDGVNYETCEVYTAILEHLGHTVSVESTDIGYRYGDPYDEGDE